VIQHDVFIFTICTIIDKKINKKINKNIIKNKKRKYKKINFFILKYVFDVIINYIDFLIVIYFYPIFFFIVQVRILLYVIYVILVINFYVFLGRVYYYMQNVIVEIN
jgi:hypothetical protein